MTSALAVTALVLGVLAGPAVPHAVAHAAREEARPVRLGIGEQLPDMFSDRRWRRLRIRDARYLARWDALAHRRARADLDRWVAAARGAHARITLSLRHSRRARRDLRAFPTDDEFRAAFRGFRARYPDVKDWIVWNEANHPSSLSARRPGRVARLFDIATATCPRCRIVGADLLDVRGMVPWVRRFLRHARHRPRIWGLHNYVDANRGRIAGTAALIEATRGTIWFTETGGLRLRRKYERRRVVHEERFSARHGARAVRHALSLACLSRRVRRVYLYNWQAPGVPTTWDSGLIGPRGGARPAYHALAALLRRAGGPVVRCRHGALVIPRR